jgi:hypothetical protein
MWKGVLIFNYFFMFIFIYFLLQVFFGISMFFISFSDDCENPAGAWFFAIFFLVGAYLMHSLI